MNTHSYIQMHFYLEPVPKGKKLRLCEEHELIQTLFSGPVKGLLEELR